MGYIIFCHATREFSGYLFTLLLSWSVMQSPHVSHQSGLDVDCRGTFTRIGYLNTPDDQNRSITDGSNVFALAYNIYGVNVTQPPAVWAIGYTTDRVINYTDLSGAPSTPRAPYYKTRYSNDKEMASTYSNSRREHMSNIETQMVDFLKDFRNASSRAQQLDGKVSQDANSVSQYLYRLNSIALAGVYGSMQLTISTDEHGNLNTSDVMMFMKSIGGVEKR